MSMVQRVFAKFISVIKFYHWRQNVHMPFNFHNIFAHRTHRPQAPSILGKYYDGSRLAGVSTEHIHIRIFRGGIRGVEDPVVGLTLA